MKPKKTVTDKVLMANRANAQKSSGPRNTDAVKHNAHKHGLLSKNLHFESDEEKEAFQQLLKELEEEQKPAGLFDRVLVEDAALSIWKLRTINGWDIMELINRRKAAKAVLKTLEENYDNEQLQLFTGWDEKRSAATRGWDCQELIIKTATRNVEQEDKSLGGVNSKAGQVQIEAKLTTSLDAILRYQAAIKRDLYRARAALRDTRRDRDGEV